MSRPNKKFVETVVEKLTLPVLNVLHLDPKSVEVFIVARNSKEFTQYKIDRVCGLTVSSSNNTHKVYIVWNNAVSRRDVIGTLVHELLHVRMFQFKMPCEKEEKLVRQLEELVLLFMV